jgi:hypothetical protein
MTEPKDPVHDDIAATQARLDELLAKLREVSPSLLEEAMGEKSPDRNMAAFELDAAMRIYAAMIERGITDDGWNEEGAVDAAWRRARLFVDRMPKGRLAPKGRAT